MTLDPGEMRDRIEIQRSAITHEGPFTFEVWETVITLWSRVKYQSGREFLQAGQISSNTQAVFSIRWREGLLTSDRILHKGLWWSITAIIPVGFKVGVDLYATSLNLEPPS